jgi:DNA repair protein RadC
MQDIPEGRSVDEQCKYPKESKPSKGESRQSRYRVRELVCSYRPVRDSEGQIVRVPMKTLNTPRDAATVIAPLVSCEPVEVLAVVCMSARHEFLSWHVVSRGNRDTAVCSIADAFVPLCVTPTAVGLILVHNHPGGDPTPSADDIALTNRLASAAALLGFSLLDHLVIGDEGKYYSFREAGLLASTPRT